MNKLLIPTFAVLAVLALSLAAQPVSAGVEPSPFWPQENEVLNMVKNLDVAEIKLEHMLSENPGKANGIYKHRLEVTHEVTQYLGDLYGKLVDYVAELPADTTRGRNAAKVLGDGIETTGSMISTVDDYLRNPEGEQDREFIAALSDLRLGAQETLPMLIEAWEKVGGVEPSPF